MRHYSGHIKLQVLVQHPVTDIVFQYYVPERGCETDREREREREGEGCVIVRQSKQSHKALHG